MLHWVIVGGESGPKSRPCALEWIDDLRRQCQSAEVAFFAKQLGRRPYVENANLWDWPLEDDAIYCDPPSSVSAAAAAGVKLRDPKGGDWEGWPDSLRVRQFPKMGGRANE